MIRALFAIAGLFGLALLAFDAIKYPWWSPLFSASTFELAWALTCHPFVLWILAILILRRIWVIHFFIQLFVEAVRWRYYQGPDFDYPIWTDDYNPDAI